MTQQELDRQTKHYRKLNILRFKKNSRIHIDAMGSVLKHNLLHSLKMQLLACLLVSIFCGSGLCTGRDTVRANESVAALVQAIQISDSSDAGAAYLLPFKAEIDSVAKRYHVPPALLAAFIQEESAFDQYATRTEPGYLKKKQVIAEAKAWSKNFHGIPTAKTELFLRASSWGPMQVMGQVAREQGFKERYLSALITPFNSIDQGAKLLLKNLKRYPRDTLSAISAYNQGNNRKRKGHYVNARYVYRVEVAWQVYEDLFNEKAQSFDENENTDHQTNLGRITGDSSLWNPLGNATARMFGLLRSSGSDSIALAFGKPDSASAQGLGSRAGRDSTGAYITTGEGKPLHPQTAGDPLEAESGRTAAIGGGLACLFGLYWLLCRRHDATPARYDFALPESVDLRVQNRLKAELAQRKSSREFHRKRFLDTN